jgi:serine/threonine-protein kinase
VLTPGHRLDRYELLCPIASGGMATVWLARLRGKRGFEKLVAIKTIKTELIKDPTYHEMFLDEARIASGIQHPNVAQILDLGEQDENLYLVMEWVDGDSLAKVARMAAKKSRPVPVDLALRIMADACAGLHAAHELRGEGGKLLGVVHRDVSPQNILVTNAGAAKVIDFGLAKADHRDAPDTQAGVVKGKLRYLSPEYVNGKGVDRRADVWAAGICLWEIVTGETPYDDLGDIDVVRHLMKPDPAPPVEDERIPAAVRPVLARALASDPADRFPTASAMRRAIEQALDDLGKSPTTEDVADFIADVLPELAERRARTVEKVMATLKPSPSLVPEAHVPSPIVVVPPPPASSQAVALVRRKPPSRPPPPPPAPEDDATSTAAATLGEQLGARPRSRVGTYFFLAIVGVAAFAAFIWPGRDRLRAMAGASNEPSVASAPAPEPPPPASAPPPTATVDRDPAPPASASAAASVTSPAPIAPRPTRAAPIATTSDAGRPKWDYRPDGWQEPSDPVLAAPSSSATPAGADAGP